MPKKSPNQTGDALSVLRAKQEKEFQRIFEETFRKANPQRFSNNPAPVAEVAPNAEEYDPEKAKSSPMYRFQWRKRFIEAGLSLPPELQKQKTGRKLVNEDNAQKIKRCRERKKLEASGLPIPEKLQKRSHANKRYMKRH